MKLEDVKDWAYGGNVKGYRATTVPGLLVLESAFGDAPIPADLLEKARKLLQSMLDEWGMEGTAECMLVDGSATLVNGKWWWAFRTFSSFSWSGWVGYDKDGNIDCVEELEEI